MPSPVGPGASLVRFFRDQQDCVLWYFCLRPGSSPFIVHSTWSTRTSTKHAAAAASSKGTATVSEAAPDSRGESSLDEEQRAYVNHYRASG
ncbi:hypothetical protein ACWD26_07935 [Streptomyces sp. NPDC002787]